MKLDAIAELIGGSVKGDGSLEINDVRSVENADEGHITYLTHKKFIEKLQSGKASAVIVSAAMDTDKAQVIVGNPALAFARVLAHMHPASHPEPGIHPQSAIGKNVRLGKNIFIGALAVIGDNVSIEDGTVVYPGVVIGANCHIGSQCVLHPNVTVYRDTTLGNGVILHAGVVIGSDGFGYTPDERGRHFKINQIGRVVIENNVEIGANSCIDRATMGVTLIKEGTKIDNLVQVAHNCSIGEHSILVAQVGIAGSCTLGHHVILAGQVGVADHVNIGDQAIVTARTAVLRDIESKSAQGGYPGVELSVWKRYVSILPKLPALIRRLKELENRLDKIENEKP